MVFPRNVITRRSKRIIRLYGAEETLPAFGYLVWNFNAKGATTPSRLGGNKSTFALRNPKMCFISVRCSAPGAENLTYRYFNSSSLSVSYIHTCSYIHACIRSTRVFRANCIYRNSETYSPQRKYRPLVCAKERDRREVDCVCGDAMSLKRSIRHRCLVLARF